MRRIKINKKGVTPIIAIILLMMMTVAAAGAAFFWIVRVQSTLTGGTEQHIDTVFGNIGATAEFRDMSVDNAGLNLTFTLRNTGSVPFTVDYNDTTLTLKKLDGTIICTEDWDSASINASNSGIANGTEIAINSITSVDLSLTTAQNCDLPTGTLEQGEGIQYTNYFGADVVASGSFQK